jgi:hypothetical protein
MFFTLNLNIFYVKNARRLETIHFSHLPNFRKSPPDNLAWLPDVGMRRRCQLEAGILDFSI